jgi:epoxyqueuosine reductase
MTIGTEELTDIGRHAGLDAVGVAPAEPFSTTRRHLEERRAAGLHGGMAFTYRNPARSTDPAATVPGARALVVGAKAYGAPEPPPPDGPAGRVARYVWTDHYAVLRDALSPRS